MVLVGCKLNVGLSSKGLGLDEAAKFVTITDSPNLGLK
jgi:hypothetical protein